MHLSPLCRVPSYLVEQIDTETLQHPAQEQLMPQLLTMRGAGAAAYNARFGEELGCAQAERAERATPAPAYRREELSFQQHRCASCVAAGDCDRSFVAYLDAAGEVDSVRAHYAQRVCSVPPRAVHGQRL